MTAMLMVLVMCNDVCEGDGDETVVMLGDNGGGDVFGGVGDCCDCDKIIIVIKCC